MNQQPVNSSGELTQAMSNFK